MGAAYSNLGRTKVLYATSFVLLGAKAKFLRRKPKVLVALDEIPEYVDPNPCSLWLLYQDMLQVHYKLHEESLQVIRPYI